MIQKPSKYNQMKFNDQLLSSIKEGDNEFVQAVLQSSDDLYHSVDSSGSTLLHYCARYGNAIITQILLNNNCDVNAKDSEGNTSLIISMLENQVEVVKMLLLADSDIFQLNYKKESALYILCKKNHEINVDIYRPFVDVLRKKCPTSEEVAMKLIEVNCPIFFACHLMNYKIVKFILENSNSPVDSAHILAKVTGLHIGVCFGNLKMVKLLLNFGANPKALDFTNASSLSYLYYGNIKNHSDNVEILKILLGLGLTSTSCNLDGRFDIGQTLMKGSPEAIRVVLESNFNFQATDTIDGWTILHYLAQNSNPGVSDELTIYMDKWFDLLDVVDKNGLTPLVLAAITANFSMIHFLISKKADPFVGKYPPLYYIYTRSKPELQNQYDECADLLLQYAPNLQGVFVGENNEKVTIFEIACNTNDMKRIKPIICQLLLDEKMGVRITRRTLKKIKSDSKISEYFESCREVIGTKILGTVSFSKLVFCCHKRMERYLNNEPLVREIKDFIKKHKIKTFHPYLYNNWRESYTTGKIYKDIKDAAADNLCKIFGHYIDNNHIIVDIIIDYLDIPSLGELSSLEK